MGMKAAQMAGDTSDAALTKGPGRALDLSLNRAEPRAAMVPTGAGWTFFLLMIDLVIVTSLLALTTFTEAAESVAGSIERAGQFARHGLIPIVLLLFGGRVAWKSLLQREPESDPLFRRKHRRFQLAAGIIIGAVIVSAAGLGLTAANRQRKADRLNALAAQARRLGSKHADLARQIVEMHSKPTQTMKEFYAKCLAVESLLDALEPNRRELLAVFNSLASEVGDAQKAPAMIETQRAIFDKDSRIVALLRTEIASAKQLIALPSSKQAAFYETEIIPIEAQIAELEDEAEVLLLRAQQQGFEILPYSSDLRKEQQ